LTTEQAEWAARYLLKQAILLFEFKIVVSQVPGKWRYRRSNAQNGGSQPSGESGNAEAEYNRIFQIGALGGLGGLEVQKFTMTNNPMNDFSGSNIIPNGDLKFIIGGKEISPGTALPDEFYGLIPVTVKYTDPLSFISATDEFLILASSNYASTIAFDYANLTDLNAAVNNSSHPIVNSDNDFLNNLNGSAYNTIHIIRLGTSFDIPDITLQASPNGSTPRSRLYIFVATSNNIILGRGGSGATGNRIGLNGDNSGLVAFYFGRWPFDGLRNSPANLNGTTRKFTVNAGGSYTAPNTNTITRKMISDATTASVDGGIYNVDLDEKKYQTSAGPPAVFDSGIVVNFPHLLH